jgi:hypothetical protein
MEQNELDALIVANIGDLEAALVRATEKTDLIINSSAWEILKTSLSGGEYFFEDDEDSDPEETWFAPVSWLDEDEDSDPWFRLTAGDASNFQTWLACYAAPRSEMEAIGIHWYTDKLYIRDYKAILSTHTSDLEKIEQAGFRRDGYRIFLPIFFDVSKLSEGFRNGDLTEALQPIVLAAEALMRAEPSFQRLRDSIVAKTKG